VLSRQLTGSVARGAITAMYYLTPNLERFNFRTEVVHELSIPPAAVGWAVVYALALVAVVLFLANLRFRSKDLR
jgi:ABC-type transport system involved in multi-copper enzyme maturation permease subunit